MVKHARRPAGLGGSTFWLDELKEAHQSLLSAIDELAQLTRGPVPGKGELATTRWRVSAASLSRRLIWGRIHSMLARRVTDLKVDLDLRHLQETDMNLMRVSTKHVGKWSLDAIIDDWTGYCRASEAMRRKMTDAISEEKRILYPILSELDSEE